MLRIYEGLETQVEMELRSIVAMAHTKMLAMQLRPLKESEHLYSPGADWALTLVQFFSLLKDGMDLHIQEL
jgi:hypothetical protein